MWHKNIARHALSTGRPVKMTATAALPPPTRPSEHVMIHFFELTPSAGKKYFLVMVDMHIFCANEVAKAPLTAIIPRWGIPSKISSDSGTHFANEVLDQIGKLFGTEIQKHCADHPASGGAIKRENATLKNKLAKSPSHCLDVHVNEKTCTC